MEMFALVFLAFCGLGFGGYLGYKLTAYSAHVEDIADKALEHEKNLIKDNAELARQNKSLRLLLQEQNNEL